MHNGWSIAKIFSEHFQIMAGSGNRNQIIEFVVDNDALSEYVRTDIFCYEYPIVMY